MERRRIPSGWKRHAFKSDGTLSARFIVSRRPGGERSFSCSIGRLSFSSLRSWPASSASSELPRALRGSQRFSSSAFWFWPCSLSSSGAGAHCDAAIWRRRYLAAMRGSLIGFIGSPSSPNGGLPKGGGSGPCFGGSFTGGFLDTGSRAGGRGGCFRGDAMPSIKASCVPPR